MQMQLKPKECKYNSEEWCAGACAGEAKELERLLNNLSRGEEACWRNPNLQPVEQAKATCALTMADVEDAAARWERFSAYFRVAFPETVSTNGIIESPLREIPNMKAGLEKEHEIAIPGKLWLKMDSHLPVSGSIKARGGVYEVLKTAEDIALKHGLLKTGDDYSVFHSPKFRELFSQYSIAVGSTGNLGLSIGIMSAKLGFRVTVHMSADARQWKKDLLRSKGAAVMEYRSDYSEAVRQGRILAQTNPMCHFVDDENSKTLFLGYAVAALRLKEQFEQRGIAVDREHPLLVYLPCGVGGGPGGVAFGIKQVFGDAAQCFFAEPTQACCMILGMATGKHNAVSVQDLGIDGHTVADGLAVGRASGFVGKLMEPFLSGCYTLTDERMYEMLAQLADSEKIRLEPSALAGMYGPVLTQTVPEFKTWRELHGATHLVWATGGSMVPETEWMKYYWAGKK